MLRLIIIVAVIGALFASAFGAAAAIQFTGDDRVGGGTDAIDTNSDGYAFVVSNVRYYFDTLGPSVAGVYIDVSDSPRIVSANTNISGSAPCSFAGGATWQCPFSGPGDPALIQSLTVIAAK